MVWERYRKMKIGSIERYLSGFRVRVANTQLLQKAYRYFSFTDHIFSDDTQVGNAILNIFRDIIIAKE